MPPRFLSLLLFTFVILTTASSATAQMFASGGLLAGSGSGDARLLAAADGPCDGGTWLVEGGAFVSRHVGAAAEWLRCELDEGASGRVSIRDIERDDVITGSLRVRLPVSHRLSLQALAGAGVIRADVNQITNLFDFDGRTVTLTDHRSGTELAVLGGLDVMFRIVTHVDVGASLRVYHLQRPTPAPRAGDRVIASEWTSFFPGVLTRVSW